MESKRIHLNPAQIEVLFIAAQITLLIAGRATGKTDGAIAPFTAKNITSMPRGNHAIGSATYEKVLSDILPKVKNGWERLGLIEGKHYWERKFAPANLRIDKPYFAPASAHHLIHFYNGACARLISLDRPSLFVGTDMDSAALDEVRLAKKENVTDFFRNIRGNVDKFGHLPNHHSILMTSDMPRDMRGEWLFDFEKEVDHEAVQMVIKLATRIIQLRHEIEESKTKREAKRLRSLMNDYQRSCDELRRDLIYVQYSSSLENVHVLGLKTLWQWKKTMSAEEFDATVLSIRQKQYGRLFYSMFNQQDHTYSASNFEVIDYMEREGYENAPWSRTQTDLVMKLPLELSGDFNAAILWLVFGQKLPGRLNCIGSLYVERPKKVRDLAKLFDHHYKEKKRYNNTVIFHYDQTAKGTNGMDDKTYIKDWKKHLKALGWNVRENYIGAAPTHKARHKLWTSMCDHSDLSTSNLYLNKNTNDQLIQTLENTPIRRSGNNEFKKDKASEYSKTTLPKDATHGTEAFDILIWGCEANPYRSSEGFINTLTGL